LYSSVKKHSIPPSYRLFLLMSDAPARPEDPSPDAAPFRDALFTDLYQLTMMQSYWREGMTAEATFSLFVRDLGTRNALLACGLEQALAFLEGVQFSEEALGYLAAQEQFDTDFIDVLADFSFAGDVRAVPEGTPVFPDEPLVEVTAPLPQAQLVETFLLNQITFQTNVATKARRVKDAAGEATVADFGARRTHGTDAALAGARAMYVGGVDASSNVRAGRRYGLPITGTMAHSYIEAHESEQAAFRNFSDVFPETTLLVDTYDPLEGVRKVIRLAEKQGPGFRVGALRLDSGDLGALAKQAREMLDEAGLEEVALFASGGLDEFKIRDLLAGGAPIDGFGVGTAMGVVRDQPALDSAYKLCGYAGQPRMKLSSKKSNLPGRKQVFRFSEGGTSEGGTAARDVIAPAGEDPPPEGRPLLQNVMAGGERTEAGERTPPDELRAYAEEATDALPERLRALEKTEEPYPVELSGAMRERLEEVRGRLEEQMGTEAG
jgi:nicotinate phosphoribosyltransferase